MTKALIPTFLTAARVVFGTLAIGEAINGDYLSSARLIILGIVLDAMDGPVARALDQENED